MLPSAHALISLPAQLRPAVVLGRLSGDKWHGMQIVRHPRFRRLVPRWLRRATGLDQYEKDDVADFVRMASSSKKKAVSPRVVKEVNVAAQPCTVLFARGLAVHFFGLGAASEELSTILCYRSPRRSMKASAGTLKLHSLSSPLHMTVRDEGSSPRM